MRISAIPPWTFEFVVNSQYVGDDIGDEVETDMDLQIVAGDGSYQKAVNYDNPDDWPTYSQHSGNWPISDIVQPERTDVTVRVSINEHDNDSTSHWVRRIKFNNRTGDVIAIMNDNGHVLPSSLSTNCIPATPDDPWGVCWNPPKVTAARPKLCASFLAAYLDSGYGQTYLEPTGSSRIQEVPARFSYAKYRIHSFVKRHMVDGVLIPDRIVDAETSYNAMDQDGCFPVGISAEARDIQYDIDGELEIELCFRSDFCKDPTGLGCETDPTNSSRTLHGTKYQVINKNNKVHEWCIVLTNDESLSSSNELDVIHASEGAFNSWSGVASNATLKYPPLEIPYKTRAQDSMTRAAGVVSTIYSRAIQSPGVAGAFLLDPNGGNLIYNLPMDHWCSLNNDLGSNRRGADGCSGGIPPDFKCNPGQDIGECVYWVLGDPFTFYYEPCEPDPSRSDCRPGLSHYKTIIAHEIGHQVQGLNRAATDHDYDLTIPGLPELCTCKHVTNGNKIHCPQGVEYWSAAFVEGYAHYFAAGVMNSDSSISNSSCSFIYGKEIVDESCRAANGSQDCTQKTIDGKSVCLAKVPVKVNCDTPELWRNRHCGGQGADLVAGTSVELDILGFLRATTIRGADNQRISNSDLLLILKTQLVSQQVTNVSWEGSTSEGSYRAAILNAVGGSQTEPHYVWARQNADSYGVSRKIY